MRSRLPASRGPQRVVVTVMSIVLLVCGYSYWRLRSVNTDLTVELHRLEALLLAADEKAAKVDEQRREVSEALKKANAEVQHLQVVKGEDNTRCRHLQENLEEVEDARAALQKQNENEREQQEEQMRGTAHKIDALEVDVMQQQMLVKEVQSKAQQERDAALRATNGCHSQLAQAQAELTQCRTNMGQVVNPAVPADGAKVAVGPAVLGEGVKALAGPVVAGGAVKAPASPALPDVGRKWPGLLVPRGKLGQDLFESGGMQEFQQAPGRADMVAQPQRVLPAPPAGQKSTSSSRRPAVLGQLAVPQQKEEQPDPPAEDVDGLGVLRPPHAQEAAPGELEAPADQPAHQQQVAPPQAERPGLGEGAAASLNEGLDDVNLQYPNAQLKDDLDDPDREQEAANEVDLIRGLQDLSKGGKEGGPVDDGEPAAPAQQPPLR